MKRKEKVIEIDTAEEGEKKKNEKNFFFMSHFFKIE
jgi:hypothetical protein